MGRGPTLEEWNHFERLEGNERVPGSCYYFVRCIHCSNAYNEASVEERLHMTRPLPIHGRKSTMRAHLQKCIFAPPYVSDLSYSEEDARKRKSELVEWDYFTRLGEEGRIGESKFNYATCNYCQEAYDQMEEKPISPPARIVGRKLQLRSHLETCENALPHLPSEYLMSLSSASSSSQDARKSQEKKAMDKENTNTRAARSQMPIWQYFNRLHKTETTAYYYCVCRACQDAYEAATIEEQASMGPPSILVGRRRCMLNHLNSCPNFAKLGIHVQDLKPQPRRRSPGVKTPVVRSEKKERFLTKAYMDLIHLTIEYGLPFTWVDNTFAKSMIPKGTTSEALGSYLLEKAANQMMNNAQHDIRNCMFMKGCTTNLYFSFNKVDAQYMTFCRVVRAHQSFESIPKVNDQPRPLNCISDEVKKHIDFLRPQYNPGSIVIPLRHSADELQHIVTAMQPFNLVLLPSGADQLECLAQKIISDTDFQSIVKAVDPAMNESLQGLLPALSSSSKTSAIVFLAGFYDCCQRILASRDLITETASFWSGIERICLEYGPIVNWYQYTLRGDASLAHTAYYLACLSLVLDKQSPIRPVLTQLWRAYDPELLMLALALHPCLGLSVFRNRFAKPETISAIAVKYYTKLFGQVPTTLKHDVEIVLKFPPMSEEVEQLRREGSDEVARLNQHLLDLSNSTCGVELKDRKGDSMTQIQHCRAIKPWISSINEEAGGLSAEELRQQVQVVDIEYLTLYSDADQIMKKVLTESIDMSVDPFQTTSTVVIC